MLENAQNWQNLDFVLQLPMESFLDNNSEAHWSHRFALEKGGLRWRVSDFGLQQIRGFRRNFNATLICIARFFKQQPVRSSTDGTFADGEEHADAARFLQENGNFSEEKDLLKQPAEDLPPPEDLEDFVSKVHSFLEESQRYSPELLSRCREGACEGDEEFRTRSQTHVASKKEAWFLRFFQVLGWIQVLRRKEMAN